MYESDTHDLNQLLIPLGNKVGSIQKARNLIEEMTHPNIDWKYIVTGIRTYLYDNIYEISPHQKTVLPILYHYLREATIRKKGSTLRASDTFFDRYFFVIKILAEGNNSFQMMKETFDLFARDYLNLLINESEDGFFLENINERILSYGRLFLKSGLQDMDILSLVNTLLLQQYKLYINRSILTSQAEIDSIKSLCLKISDKTGELVDLLKSVSEENYDSQINTLERTISLTPPEAFQKIDNLADFSLNSRVWERICLNIKNLIEQEIVFEDDSILELLSYLIRKSHTGSDGNLQLFISRTVASICTTLVHQNKMDLLKGLVDLIMPLLLREIEGDGNYYSAFATIYNLGKTILEFGEIGIIDHFIDILVKAKFCFPRFTGIASDWSVIVNSSHLENIRTWLKLIEINPPMMKKLAASLIVNLKLGGVFLKDTDVFQRDISQLMTSDFSDVFYLITSLAAVFPAFYHDIGATGDIRTFTERIDTNHQMNDLVHFLRKQVHVESSSRTVSLIQRVMDFWMTGEKRPLKNMVPREVYDYLRRIFRLINLDFEDTPKQIVETVKTSFPDHSHLQFWDFLNAVGKKPLMELVIKMDFPGISEDDKRDALECFLEYYETQFPAEMTKMLHYIKSMFKIDIEKTAMWKFLYEISDNDFRTIFEDVSRMDVSRVNVEKFITFLHVYRMIFDKYNFSDIRAIDKLEQYAAEDLFAPPDNFFTDLKGADQYKALQALINLQRQLKYDILLSDVKYEPVDTIEFKRHIAFGIPSMYGSYKEKKFDTLKVFFQSNLIRARLFENIVEQLNIFPHEKIDYDVLKKVISLFYSAFEIDGLANHELQSITSLLDTPNLKISQLRDVANYLISVHGEISDQFNETYKYVCKEAINNIGIEKITENLQMQHIKQSIESIIDRFLRNQIMQSPLLQLFDNLCLRLKDFLNNELNLRGDIICLNHRDIRRRKEPLIHTIEKSPDQSDTIIPLGSVGGKAQGLILSTNLEGINVPQGAVLSSELYKRVRDGNLNNPRFQRKFMYGLKVYVDNLSGGRFANPNNPVLLSVRSGAVFSMPGVMDTITNIGVTPEIIESLSRFDPWFAYDCYRRLIHDFAISYYGMDRHPFEKLMSDAKDEARVDLKEKLTGKQMEILTKKYRYKINREGYSVPKDPYEQLFHAILAVFKSWDSPVAKKYREFVNISDEWGTFVIIQRMVFGNLSPNCITGVVQSHYVGYNNIGLFGEYKTRAQGHDIVSGVAKVFPISEAQRKKYKSSSQYMSLETINPPIYSKIYEAVKKIRTRWGNDIEMEFTIENDVLYILQIRGMTNHIFEIEELEETPIELEKYLLGQGIAASGGAVSGRAVFAIDRIDMIRERFPSDKIILIRPETNPEDVVGLKKSDGILTSVGGMTSHAVLQMRRLEKSGVSDFSAMKIEEAENMAFVTRESHEKGKFIIREGDFITIDGNTGHVYLGWHKTMKK